MTNILRLDLSATPEQHMRLLRLQAQFAQVCNALAPIVQQTRCWNRVTLHHLAYRALRERFPAMGSQMICNAIYSVSKTARSVFQNRQSPYHVQRLAGRPLPLIRFVETCPVYFDRHTMSLVGARLSLYTLEGRTRFEIDSDELARAHFLQRKLLEAVLTRDPESGRFEMTLDLARLHEADAPAPLAAGPSAEQPPVPEYVQLQ